MNPVIAQTFGLEEVQEAHRYLEANQQSGEIVVTVLASAVSWAASRATVSGTAAFTTRIERNESPST